MLFLCEMYWFLFGRVPSFIFRCQSSVVDVGLIRVQISPAISGGEIGLLATKQGRKEVQVQYLGASVLYSLRPTLYLLAKVELKCANKIWVSFQLWWNFLDAYESLQATWWHYSNVWQYLKRNSSVRANLIYTNRGGRVPEPEIADSFPLFNVCKMDFFYVAWKSDKH